MSGLPRASWLQAIWASPGSPADFDLTATSVHPWPCSSLTGPGCGWQLPVCPGLEDPLPPVTAEPWGESPWFLAALRKMCPDACPDPPPLTLLGGRVVALLSPQLSYGRGAMVSGWSAQRGTGAATSQARRSEAGSPPTPGEMDSALQGFAPQMPLASMTLAL